MWLAMSGYVIESVMCVGVQCWKNLLFLIKLILIQMGSKFDVFHPNFGPPSLTREVLKKNGLWMPKMHGIVVRNLGPNSGRTPV